jgi:type IV secretory pathway ATPase VirB11/archaellum biosynthesis ATPase
VAAAVNALSLALMTADSIKEAKTREKVRRRYYRSERQRIAFESHNDVFQIDSLYVGGSVKTNEIPDQYLTTYDRYLLWQKSMKKCLNPMRCVNAILYSGIIVSISVSVRLFFIDCGAMLSGKTTSLKAGLAGIGGGERTRN